MEKVLITGGTGLVGRRLSEKLFDKGYQVEHLSRGSSEGRYKTHQWDLTKGSIDSEALKNVSYIVHLAGAGVADKKWTTSRKELIRSSRIGSTNLLYNSIKSQNIPLKAFISASAVGLYGMTEGDELFDENSNSGNDFLANVVVDWEKAIDQFSSLDIRTVKLRIGIVLSAEGGALPKIAQPIKFYAGAPLGTGKQIMSWVHIDDLAEMFLMAIENSKMDGAYNAVNPNPVTNQEFTKIVANKLKKPLWLPNVPSFALKLMLGEMAGIVTTGANVSCEKIVNLGFKPQFESAEAAINDLL